MDYKPGHDRYEALRLLGPCQFCELYNESIRRRIPFDALVDKLVKEREKKDV